MSFGAIADEDVQHLGRADAVENVDADRLAPPLAHVRRQCFAGGNTNSQPFRARAARQILMREHRRIERRHAVEDGRLLAPQDIEHRVGRRATGKQHRGRADRHRKRHGVAEPIGEKQLGRGVHHVVLADAEHVLAIELRGRDQARVHVLGALGFAGRARRIEPEGDLVGDRGRGLEFRLSARKQLLEKMRLVAGENRLVRGIAAHDHERAQMRQPVEDRRDGLGERRRDEDRLDPAVVEDIGVLLRGEQRVQRNAHHAGTDRAPERDRVVDRVEQQERDPAFLLQAERAEAPRKVRGFLLQFAISELPLLVDERDLAAAPARHVGVDEVARGVIGAPLRELIERNGHGHLLGLGPTLWPRAIAQTSNAPPQTPRWR